MLLAPVMEIVLLFAERLGVAFTVKLGNVPFMLTFDPAETEVCGTLTEKFAGLAVVTFAAPIPEITGITCAGALTVKLGNELITVAAPAGEMLIIEALSV